MKLLGLSGSPTLHSRSHWLLESFHRRLLTDHCDLHDLGVLRIRDLPAKHLLQADATEPSLNAALALVQEADLVLLSTPIYKAAYSGLLKVFLDLLPHTGLQDKSIVALATGGSPAHLLALDYALKPVAGVLGARDILDAIFATDSQLPIQDTGVYHTTPEVDARMLRASHRVGRHLQAHTLLQQHDQPAHPPGSANGLHGPGLVRAVRISG